MRDYLYNLATDKYQGLIPGIIKLFLFILSCFYGLAVRVLISFYRLKLKRLNCRVISIGNITLGGTGKTALVEYIARYLKGQGKKIAILSRGYKRKVTKSQSQCEAKRSLPKGGKVTSSQIMGDEPYMLSQKLFGTPIIVDADRIRSAQQAIKEYGADTVILDDGFQQWKLKKDLEIVTIDATDPFGNQRLIPRGILREPLSSLKRADMFILSKTNLNPDIADIKDFLARINPQAVILESMHQSAGFYDISKPETLININALQGKGAALFCGIADPDSFENLILSLGIKVGLSFRFHDHHNYTKEDLDKIVAGSKDKNIDTIITTEKDAARLCDLRVLATCDLQVLVLRIKLEIKNEERLHRRLLRLYSD